MTNDHEKNVEYTLMRVCRRRPGDVPYPVEHTGPSSSIIDIWNNMYRIRNQNITMHPFEKDPALVLDLGCGSGYWAIEAAKIWKQSTIIGFDVRNIQTRLSCLEQHGDIAHRIKWVHGNLLDGLPFSPNLFDFVRIANIGLGVPEDEWQFVFEEVYRVMKSGGVVEVIEEDPIFPCAQQPQSIPSYEPPLSTESKSTSPTPPAIKSAATLTLDSWDATLEEYYFGLNSPTCPPTLHSFRNLNLAEARNNPYSAYVSSQHRPSLEQNRHPDLRDHLKLKAAWNAMLSSRWIAPNPLSLIPFYISSCFADVQSYPLLQILLPPNSATGSEIKLEGSSSDFVVVTGSKAAYTKKGRVPPILTGFSHETVLGDVYTTAECASMHLGYTFHTVSGCKDAIWQEYKKMYDVDIIPPATARNATHFGDAKSSIRESFDDEWASWQSDITDRMGIRMSLASQFGWTEPTGDPPAWQIWRTMVAKADLNEGNRSLLNSPQSTTEAAPDVCRSIRVFVGFKP